MSEPTLEEYRSMNKWYDKLRRTVDKIEKPEQRIETVKAEIAKALPAPQWATVWLGPNSAYGSKGYIDLVYNGKTEGRIRVGSNGQISIDRRHTWTYKNRELQRQIVSNRKPQEYIVNRIHWYEEEVIVSARNQKEAAEMARKGKIVRVLNPKSRSGMNHIEPRDAKALKERVLDNMTGGPI